MPMGLDADKLVFIAAFPSNCHDFDFDQGHPSQKIWSLEGSFIHHLLPGRHSLLYSPHWYVSYQALIWLRSMDFHLSLQFLKVASSSAQMTLISADFLLCMNRFLPTHRLVC